MSLPRYPEYKESEMDWLGELPSHWGVRKFRHSFQESSEKIDGDVVGPMLSVSGYRGIEVKEYDDENRRRTDQELQGYRIVRPGQLVVNTMWLNYAGLGVSDYEGHVSPAYRAYWILADLESRFVHYMMRSGEFVKGYTKYLTGIRPNSLQMSRDDLMEFRLAEPPKEEQASISDFLDRETAKIDALIGEQETLLVLLAEKRHAVISHAVTSGLSPGVPLKDSGVHFLGRVPEHWQVTRLKFVANVQTGIAKGKDVAGKDVITVPYLRVANVQDGFLALEDIATMEIEFDLLSRYRLFPGDVLMNEGGDFDKLGRGAIWRGEITDCIHQNYVFAVRPHGVCAEWLNQITNARYAQFYFMGRAKQSTNLASISSTNIMELPVLLPSAEEQAAILAFIDEETGKIDALKASAEQAIELLRERRSALISAAVTGKIDVRGLVEPKAAA
jgi:type I restriction enzyme S subunit